MPDKSALELADRRWHADIRQHVLDVGGNQLVLNCIQMTSLVANADTSEIYQT